MDLRDYQKNAIRGVYDRWNAGARNVMLVSPTGSGKTHMKSKIVHDANVPSCVIAHRQELVLQISSSLAAFGVYHDIIGPNSVVQFCVRRHVKLFGRSFYQADAPVAVAGVNTLVRRAEKLKQFCSRVQLWDIDEAHHVLPDNIWGKAVSLFPNAYGLGVTATPLRCDRQGLDGVFDDMVVGPTMRDLIDQGFLTDYRIFCPPTSIDIDNIRTSSNTGEYVHRDVVEESERSTIIGDVVDHYKRIAPGKRGLTFAVNVELATQIAAKYNENNVPAAVVTAKTPDNVRTDLLDRLAEGSILQLVNVDLFGEGMDCPALDVVSMARPTQSYGLYVQQFGRALRPHPDKERAIIIDHVGNVVRHGLPDAPRAWSLAAPERRSRVVTDEVPLTACLQCFFPYRSNLTACPHCGNVDEPVSRGTPEHVAGDLIELDPQVLAIMRGEADVVMGSPRVPRDADAKIAMGIANNWKKRQDAQTELRDEIAAWAGYWKHGQGETDSEIHRRFFIAFGTDILSAQSMGTADARKLSEKLATIRNER